VPSFVFQSSRHARVRTHTRTQRRTDRDRPTAIDRSTGYTLADTTRLHSTLDHRRLEPKQTSDANDSSKIYQPPVPDSVTDTPPVLEPEVDSSETADSADVFVLAQEELAPEITPTPTGSVSDDDVFVFSGGEIYLTMGHRRMAIHY